MTTSATATDPQTGTSVPASTPATPQSPGVSVPVSRYYVFFAILILGTFWDLYSKEVVFRSLGYPGGTSTWMQTYLNGWVKFQLHTSFNEGALWGIGQGYTQVFAALSVAAAIGIICWLFVFRAARSLWLTVTMGLVMAGTMGNLYDRLGLHGCEVMGRELFAVRDFLAFTFGNYHYPIFNFADVFLVTGAVMLAIFSLFVDLPENKPADKATSPTR
ncbi:signal peptidase II [Rubinisphaera margarita]|uniref:signal peptidase II n=1 Tax=Rubinisphaera margarita TaxID=2909586 RepID=UPI001EE7C0D3|nr:signal peptidase II [Rubinisphaera margarita]MCG6154991.1 signal peptidase II [Rubinisphaera margarita]